MISRFCDFVTGSSQELYELFADLKKMFHQTGYILQQVDHQTYVYLDGSNAMQCFKTF